MGIQDTSRSPVLLTTLSAVVQALRTHTYDYRTKGSRPDDPGWHMCRCGEWAGYWCDFYDEHLAPEILKVLGDVTDV